MIHKLSKRCTCDSVVKTDLCGRTEVQQKKWKIGRLPRNEKQKGKGKRFDKGKDERST